MRRMPTIPRRVVTGHDSRGVSVFASDGPVAVTRNSPDGAYFCEVLGGLLQDPISTGPINPGPAHAPGTAVHEGGE